MRKSFGLFFNKSDFSIPGFQFSLFGDYSDANTSRSQGSGLSKDMLGQHFSKTAVSVRWCDCQTFEIAMTGLGFFNCRASDG